MKQSECSLTGRLFRCRGYPRHRAGCRPNKEPGSYWLEITSLCRQITCKPSACEFFRGIILQVLENDREAASLCKATGY
jgi:hypothetical protein